MILHLDHGPERTTLNEFYLVGLVQIPVLFLKVRVDIPGVPLLGLVDEGLQQVSAG